MTMQLRIDSLFDQLDPHHFKDEVVSTCPACDSPNIEEMKRELDLDTDRDQVIYRCHDCGNEFQSSE